VLLLDGEIVDHPGQGGFAHRRNPFDRVFRDKALDQLLESLALAIGDGLVAGRRGRCRGRVDGDAADRVGVFGGGQQVASPEHPGGTEEETKNRQRAALRHCNAFRNRYRAPQPKTLRPGAVFSGPLSTRNPRVLPGQGRGA
jgi:hypothetical protein